MPLREFIDTGIVQAQTWRQNAKTPRAVPARTCVMSVHAPSPRDGTLRRKARQSVCAV
jgi:hypothetical protein